MEKNRISIFMIIFTSFFMMVGCNVGSAFEPTQTPTETATLTPIPPTATATVTPTATLTPTPTVTFTPTLGVGSNQVNPKDGMVMVYVPEGEFLMGSKDDDPEAKPDEKPQHKVYLDAFWIYQIEVTNSMFQKFIEATGHETYVEKMEKKKVPPMVWKFDPCCLWLGTWIKGANWQYPLGPSSDIKKTEHDPVGQLDWGDADAYCLWAGGRLPTEAEWEKAARGTDGRIYPFGEGIDCNFVNYYSKDKWCVNEFLPVGSYPKGASPYGILDMAGSVFEWVADWYSREYYNNSSYENPTGPESGRYHVIRGYYGLMGALPRAARRFVNNPGGGYVSVSNLNGFRCAVSP